MTGRRGSAVVVGIGQTPYSRASGRPELALALDAITAALADAALSPHDVDGVVRFTYESSDETDIARNLGCELGYYGAIPYGGLAAPAVIAHAAAAIEAGLATTVVCYRALNGRSGSRYGRAERSIAQDPVSRSSGEKPYAGEFSGPYGLLAPGQMLALRTRRYAAAFGISLEDLTASLGEVCVTQRAYASRNPAAVLKDQPLTIDMYREGRMISSPLRVYDHCLETDGACAVVLTSRERARDLRRRPIAVLAGAQRLVPTDYPAANFWGDAWNAGVSERMDRLFARAGVDRGDVDVACVYEAVSPMVLWGLEELGFCAAGEAPAYVAGGGMRLTGAMPTNTHGGHLSEAYVHGLNHVLEAVRQLRGEACNQVTGAEVAVVHVSIGGGSTVILGR